jgi:hypothetical protein
MKLQEKLIKDIVMTSPALKSISENYPSNRYGKIPLKIKMSCTVKSDLPMFIDKTQGLIAFEGQEYFVWCNSHGAMSAILPNGEKLGIRPSECEIIQWH